MAIDRLDLKWTSIRFLYYFCTIFFFVVNTDRLSALLALRAWLRVHRALLRSTFICDHRLLKGCYSRKPILVKHVNDQQKLSEPAFRSRQGFSTLWCLFCGSVENAWLEAPPSSPPPHPNINIRRARALQSVHCLPEEGASAQQREK